MRWLQFYLHWLIKATYQSTEYIGADMHTKPRDACGIVGIYNLEDAARHAVLGLHALQHRGQESAGVVTALDGKLHCHKGMGLVANVFPGGSPAEGADRLPGTTAIGHVRYSTAGGSNLVNAQPLIAGYMDSEVALGHNGNLCQSQTLRAQLASHGALFQTSTDSELVLHLLAQHQAKTPEEIARVLALLGPAFSLVMLYPLPLPGRLIAARDPWGFRPLVLGELKRPGKSVAMVVASETCALDQIEAEYVREIEPGEMVIIDHAGLRSIRFAQAQTPLWRCLLEHIYFARPDSLVFGETPHLVRERCGEALAKEQPVAADIVVPIPDSGFSAAMGYARAINIPLERGLIRNHYVGRSFIAPGQHARAMAVRMKHNIVREVVEGKRIVLVDDSLIRGTTTATLAQSLRKAGAKEVHLRIACPPTRHPCAYGVDFPDRDELIAHNRSVDEIRHLLELDSLGYLSEQGLLRLFGQNAADFCTACWSGCNPKLEP